jgi:membrane associated rhomboid family serine protease
MFVIPIGHDDLSVRRLPWVTIGIAAICTLLQFHACSVESEIEASLESVVPQINELIESVAEQCNGDGACDEASVVAGLRDRTIGDQVQQDSFAMLDAQLKEAVDKHPSSRLGFEPESFSPIRMLTYMFAHGGFFHLLGNMLFLYLVGLSIEDRWGRLRFAIFYLVGGAAAAIAYGAVHPGSKTPLVGASGAIAAAMGAFAILYFKTQIRFFYFWLFRTGTFRAPAWLVLPLWFAEQLWSISAETSGLENVGYSSHAGGFFFGAVVALVIRVIGADKRFQDETEIASGGWVQDPLFAEASALAEKGDDRAALSKLSQLLSKRPDELDARELAFDIAARTSNWRIMQRHAAVLFPKWIEITPERAVEGYQRIAALAGADPIDDRVLDLALTAASTTANVEVVQQIMRQLFHRAVPSPLLPKALFVMAEIYSKQGRGDLEANLLQRLVRDHPQDQWTERARERMR